MKQYYFSQFIVCVSENYNIYNNTTINSNLSILGDLNITNKLLLLNISSNDIFNNIYFNTDTINIYPNIAGTNIQPYDNSNLSGIEILNISDQNILKFQRNKFFI